MLCHGVAAKICCIHVGWGFNYYLEELSISFSRYDKKTIDMVRQ